MTKLQAKMESNYSCFSLHFSFSLTNIGSGGVEEGVKYYRGQITMTVTSSAPTAALQQPTTTKKTSTTPALTTSENSALENRENVLNHLENKSK